MSCISAAQLKFWFQTDLGRENLTSYYRPGRQLLLTLLTMITRWSRSSSNFYAVIGQNLTGESYGKFTQHLEQSGISLNLRTGPTFQPMRRRACVYQHTNQNIALVIKNFHNSGRRRTESNLTDPNCLQFLAIQVVQRMHAMHVQPVAYEHSL